MTFIEPVLFFLSFIVIAYPFVGAVLYEDPWSWPIKKEGDK